MTAVNRVAYEPGRDPSVKASEDLVACRMIKINGTWADGANLPVEYCDGGAGTAGAPDYLTMHDIASGKVGHAKAPTTGLVAEWESSATIADGAFVKVTTDGKAAAASATGDVVVGKVLRGGNNGDRLLVKFMAPSVLKIA